MTELSLARFKTCTKCGCIKPATNSFFSKHKLGRFGLRSVCKVCTRCDWHSTPEQNTERRRRYLAANKEAVAERKRLYRQKNKERLRKKDRLYYLANREKFAEHNRRYREANKEALAEYNRLYHQANKEAKAEYYRRWRTENQDKRRVHELKRQALKRDGEGFEDVADMWQMYEDQGGLCAYCEEPLFGDFHIDHMVPLSRGGADDWTNYAIACPTCNLRKHAKTLEDFMNRRLRG